LSDGFLRSDVSVGFDRDENKSILRKDSMPGRNRSNPGKLMPALIKPLAVIVVALIGIELWLVLGGLPQPGDACRGPSRATGVSSQSVVPTGFRAFENLSYWNTPLAADAPVDENSEHMIDFLERDNSTDYIELAGTGASGRWGNPIYWSTPKDPVCTVVNTCNYKRPQGFIRVRIPSNAGHDPTSDAAMTVYDKDKEIVYGFYQARYDKANDQWSACGGTVYYLDSNGLDGSLAQSDEEKNFGHRGVPPSTYAVRYDEIKAGSIDHVLKIAINTAHQDHVWPMTGSDGDSTATFAPPEGARLRLKPSINLAQLDLTRAELTIATALQRYGAVIGDQSGATAVLKVENTVAEGRGQLWKNLLAPDSLKEFSFDDFEFVRLGYGS
jgi:hypothetical protein